MLAISHVAAEAIKQIVSASPFYGEGGIRISADPVDDHSLRLDLTLAESPEAGDVIVEEEGANVFVEPVAAPFLNDKVLDAAVDADKVSFSIVEARQDWSNDGQPESFDPRGLT